MPKESIIIQLILFASLLFAILAIVLITFMMLYQKKRIRHKHQLQQMEENFNREILSAQIEIQEQTLEHVASELHDNFNSSLSVVNLNLAGVLPHLSGDTRGPVVEAKTVIKQLMSEMRSLSASLNRDHLLKIGLVRAMEKHIELIKHSGLLEVRFSKEGLPCNIPPRNEIILFRMCQEIINNVIKHSGASQVIISLVCTPDSFSIEISDDGVGFNTDQEHLLTEDKESTGLRNLRKRAKLLNADFAINSAPGKGTSVIIHCQQENT
ncbi:MAG: ATP-binding protein [Bacteroidetes bacterium]|nr:ATP-binding protein [Bacteroidota bacterium]